MPKMAVVDLKFNYLMIGKVFKRDCFKTFCCTIMAGRRKFKGFILLTDIEDKSSHMVFAVDSLNQESKHFYACNFKLFSPKTTVNS